MNAYSIVTEFEQRVADFAGAKFGVAVDCCTNAIFLSMLTKRGMVPHIDTVYIPCRTYVSVPNACRQAGFIVELVDKQWEGIYQLFPYAIWDGAKRFRKGMYVGGLHCLSFHIKKHLPIGRGGMILTNDEEAASWLRKMRYDGREGKPYDQEVITEPGYHMYMTPEQAARGLALMDVLPSDNLPDLTEDYPDLRKMPLFKNVQIARVNHFAL